MRTDEYSFRHFTKVTRYRAKQLRPLTNPVGFSEFWHWLREPQRLRVVAVYHHKTIVGWACMCRGYVRYGVGVFIHPDHRRKQLATRAMDLLLMLTPVEERKTIGSVPIEYERDGVFSKQCEELLKKYRLPTEWPSHDPWKNTHERV